MTAVRDLETASLSLSLALGCHHPEQRRASLGVQRGSLSTRELGSCVHKSGNLAKSTEAKLRLKVCKLQSSSLWSE